MTALPRVTLTVPEQPPIGSVVLATEGVAHQRHTDGAWYAPRASRGMSWAALLAAHGHVDVLHVCGCAG